MHLKLDIGKAVDYFVIFLLVAMTGIPFFAQSTNKMLIIVFCIVSVVYIIKRPPFHKFVFYYLLLYTIVQVIWILRSNTLFLSTYMGILMKILLAYFTLSILGKKFFDYYINLLVFLTLISFFFYFTSFSPGIRDFYVFNLAPNFVSPFVNYAGNYVWPNIIIYTFNFSGDYTTLMRNSAAFWEPGVYAGFVSVALMFNLIKTKSLKNRNSLILMAGLFTTFSTTGLIALVLIILSFLLIEQKLIYKLALIPLIVIGSYVAFTSIEFLGTKIRRNMDIQNAAYNTRFGSAVLDLKDFADNPLFGMGRNRSLRYKGETDKVTIHRTNGLTDYLASYGIFVFVIYFVLLYYTFRRYCEYNAFNIQFALFCLGIIMLLGFSEGYFNRPFFYGLTLAHLVLDEV